MSPDCQSAPLTSPDQPIPPLAPSLESPLSTPSTPLSDDDMSTSPSLTSPAPMAMDAAMPPTSSLAMSLGASAGAAGIPDMIGDFFGNGYNYGFVGPNATVAVAGGDRRVKFADNNSPFPRNRVFFNYNNFQNAVVDVNGQDSDLNRYSFGLERAFWDGLFSAEVRAPFSGTVSSSPVSGDASGATEFGNVALAFKGLLYEQANLALSMGLAVVLPTGDDFSVQGDVVDNLFTNEAVHLQPFIGVYYAPQPRIFTMFFSQLDFDTNGNDVSISGINDNLKDQTLLFLDLSTGYWLYRDHQARYLRAVAPMIELHYSTTLENQEYGAFEGVQLSTGPIFIENARRDILNITGGVFFELGRMSALKIGAAAPLRDGTDSQFDTELSVQFTRRY